LRKHGMADKSDDAYKQAEALLTSKKEEVLPPFQPSSQVSNELLLEHKFTLALEMNNKKFQAALDIISTTIASLAQEVTGLKRELSDLKSVPVRKPVVSEPEVSKKEQPKESHPRQGQFVPGDVSIEKMFYFGKK